MSDPEASPQHTPTPWEVEWVDFGGHGGLRAWTIAGAREVDEFPTADVHLIAAAPDLLAALKALREADRNSDQSAVCKQADAAIAKAEGRGAE